MAWRAGNLLINGVCVAGAAAVLALAPRVCHWLDGRSPTQRDRDLLFRVAQSVGAQIERDGPDSDGPIVALDFELNHTSLLDAALELFEGLTELRRLSLKNNSAISDAGLVHLRGLNKLAELDVRGTRVTPAGVEWLRSVLPQARVLSEADSSGEPH